jgi:hypothetical protein
MADKRYYYDCPIQAAYMAKYFGMRFCIGSDNEKSYGIKEEEFTEGEEAL